MDWYYGSVGIINKNTIKTTFDKQQHINTNIIIHVPPDGNERLVNVLTPKQQQNKNYEGTLSPCDYSISLVPFSYQPDSLELCPH